MSLVDNLSKYVVIPIYCNWLDVVNVCRLDSSFCSHTERENFLSYIVGNEHLAFRGIVFSSNKVLGSFLNWIDARRIKPVDLNIRGNCTQKIENKLFDCLTNLQVLSITGNVNMFRESLARLIKSCLNLKEIHISAYQLLTEDIVTLLADTCGASLNVIDFPCYQNEYYSLNDCAMDYLFAKCTQLTSLTLRSFIFITDDCLIKMLQTCGHNLLELTLERMGRDKVLQYVGLLATKLEVFVFKSKYTDRDYLQLDDKINPATTLSPLVNNCRDLKSCNLTFPVHYSCQTEYCAFYDTLTINCVSLTSISICCVADDSVNIVTKNCQGRLRYITLRVGALQQSTFVDLIRRSPLLHSLDIIGCYTVDEYNPYFCTDMKFLREQLSLLKHLRTFKMDIISIDEFPCELLALQLDLIELNYVFGAISYHQKVDEKDVSQFRHQCNRKGSLTADFIVTSDKISLESRACKLYFRRRLKH